MNSKKMHFYVIDAFELFVTFGTLDLIGIIMKLLDVLFCFFKFGRVVKDVSHISHFSGFMCKWTALVCRLRAVLSGQSLPQTSHSTWSSLRWTFFWWAIKEHFLLNVLEQMLHSNVCVWSWTCLMWSAKFLLYKKVLSHLEHANALSFGFSLLLSWIFMMCCLKTALLHNVRSHKWHWTRSLSVLWCAFSTWRYRSYLLLYTLSHESHLNSGVGSFSYSLAMCLFIVVLHAYSHSALQMLHVCRRLRWIAFTWFLKPDLHMNDFSQILHLSSTFFPSCFSAMWLL